jgi:hypothetical protein
MYGFLLAQSLSNMAIGIFTLRQQLRGLLSGNWPNSKTPYVEYLVVGGGGGGGRGDGGGGGGGGVLTGLLPVTAGVSYVTTVGGGGAQPGGTTPGVSGGNSSIGSVVALGGGGGACYTAAGPVSGGSGGGGSAAASPVYYVPGQGTFGQGNAGGYGQTSPSNGCGGGGGAGTVGLTTGGSGANNGGNGGAGIASAINGTVTPYGGGGAGGGQTTGGTGGVGGGGDGGYGGSGVPTPGLPNTGGGGGGDWNNVSTAGSGGSGIVIISYPDIYPALTTTTGSPTVSTSGSGSISLSSGNYFTSSSSSNLALGTNSFTAEYWINVTNAAVSNQNAVGLGTTNYNPLFGYVSTNLVLFLSSNGSSWDIASNVTIGTPTSATWAHVAIVRNGNNFYTFFNGVQGATFSSSSSIYQNSNTVLFGTGFGNTLPFTGQVSNFRLLNGTALYPGGTTGTQVFTPPTTPLTAITNTQALFNCVSGAPFADASANSLTATVVGTPTWNQLSPFATGLGYKNRVYTWTSTGTWAVTV